MGRRYSVSFSGVAVSAAQDLFEYLVAADKVLTLHECHVSQSSDAGDSESEQLRCSIRRVTGSPTSGSGGSTPTPRPLDPGDAAAGGTIEANNTTQISGGTNVVVAEECWNVMAGMHYVPTPEAKIDFTGQTRLVVELEAAPADAVTMSGYMIVEERG